MKRTLFYILFSAIAYSGSIFGQFILPEKDFTTQKDVDVIRVDSGGEGLVKGIRFRVRKNRGEVILAWELNRKEQELAVVRHTQPINNIQVLGQAELLGIIPADQTSYLDRPSAPGEYYYAVMVHKDLQEKLTVLVADENYTTLPAVIEQQIEVETDESTAGEFKKIQATLINDDVIRVEWEAALDKDSSIQLYRSEVMIDSVEKLKNAQRISVQSSGETSYDDKDLKPGRTYFYAITSRNQDGKETVQLMANRTYTTKALSYRQKEEEVPIVKNIQAVQGPEGSIIVNWEDPLNISGSYQFFVYRSEKPILRSSDVNAAEKVGVVKAGTGQFTDRNTKDSGYYYAVVTIDGAGKMSSRFQAGQNTLSSWISPQIAKTRESMEREETSKDGGKGRFFNLQAHVSANRVVLTWNQVFRDDEEYDSNNIIVYRFRKKPSKLTDLMYGTLLGKIPDTKLGFVDIPPSSGIYYYALFLETRKGLKPKEFVSDENLVGPVVFHSEIAGQKTPAVKDEPGLEEGDPAIYDPSLEKDDERAYEEERPDTTEEKTQEQVGKTSSSAGENDQVDEILKTTYNRGEYQKALEELKPYQASQNEQVKAKALFYSALCAYKTDNYELALKYLLHPAVRKVYGERADFWYNRTLERLND